MELLHTNQVPFEELLNEQIDVIIAAYDYQAGTGHLSKIANFNSRRKIALIIKEGLDEQKKLNDINKLTDSGFECFEISGMSIVEMKDVLATICHSEVCEHIKLVVDYSSMSKFWYGTTINYFALNEMFCHNLTVYFFYSPEHYLPKASVKHSSCQPQPGVMHVNSRTINKPVALVIGLGNESEKAEFLCDFFKPVEFHLLLPNPSFTNEQTKTTNDNNRKFIAKVKSHNVHDYPANNIEEIDARLRSICLSLRLKYRVILVSLGPKTFSLASFLINARYPDVEIWNLCSSANEYGLTPTDIPIVYKAVLTNIDDEYD
jgi:hypothetical protein